MAQQYFIIKWEGYTGKAMGEVFTNEQLAEKYLKDNFNQYGTQGATMEAATTLDGYNDFDLQHHYTKEVN